MVWRYYSALGLLTVLLAPAGWSQADDQRPPTSASAATDRPGLADEFFGPGGESTFLVRGQGSYYPNVVARFGWWAVQNQGSPVKTGEFQDLGSSPFWDVDGLLSDGNRTLDFTGTGNDNEGTQARGVYYGPALTVKADYERYLRRYDSRGVVVDNPYTPAIDPIFENFNPNVPLPPAPAAQRVLNSDVLNAGQDYAIRVQQFKTNFHGPLGDNWKWRLNVWGIDKQGIRQATRTGHCFNESTVSPGQPTGSRCHVLAQNQRIDWNTVEFEPVIEGTIGAVTMEYSRTMRTFDTNDQTVTRLYTQTHEGWPITSTAGDLHPVPYDIAPENYTQIDRLKLSTDLNDYNHLYALMYAGDTRNKLRDTQRWFNGFDVRWTNDAADGLKVTGYGKKSREDGELPTTFPEAPLIQGGDNASDYHHPLSYDRTGAGVKAQWRPAQSGWPASDGLGFTGGYDYAVISRTYAVYEFDDPRWVLVYNPPNPDVIDSGFFGQPGTVLNSFNLGVANRWSAAFDSFLRYKYVHTKDPIYGFRATNADVNTNQPENRSLIEIGGTWMPTDNFLVSATFGIDVRDHDSFHDNLSAAFDVFHTNPRRTNFNEESYPIVVSAWYAPTPKWSFNGGYAYFNSSIDQLITLGDLYGDNLFNSSGSTIPNPAFPGSGPPFIGARDYFEPDAFQSRWRYGSRSNIASFGGVYACTQRVRLSSGYEYGWSRAAILSAPSPSSAFDPADTTPPPTVVVPDWTLIPTLSDVEVRTNRLLAGVDYLVRERVTVYFRYTLFDYADLTTPSNSGTMHGLLGGMTAMY